MRQAGHEEAYARRIIVNADLDQRRRPWHKRRSPLALEHVDRAVEPSVGADESADLLAAVRALPAMQRRTVVLRYWVGLSVEETAEELGIRAGTVKSHASRAVAALREGLREPV